MAVTLSCLERECLVLGIVLATGLVGGHDALGGATGIIGAGPGGNVVYVGNGGAANYIVFSSLVEKYEGVKDLLFELFFFWSVKNI